MFPAVPHVLAQLNVSIRNGELRVHLLGHSRYDIYEE